MDPNDWTWEYERAIRTEALRANRLSWRREHPSEPRDVSRRGRKPRARFERNAKEATRDVRVDVWAGMVTDVAA